MILDSRTEFDPAKFNRIKTQYDKAKSKFDPYQEAMNAQVWSFIYVAGTEAEGYFSEEFDRYLYDNCDHNSENRTIYNFLRLNEVKNHLPGAVTAEDYEISDTEKTITLGIGDGYFFAYNATFKFEELESYIEKLRDLHQEWIIKIHKEKKARKKQARKAKKEKQIKSESN